MYTHIYYRHMYIYLCTHIHISFFNTFVISLEVLSNPPDSMVTFNPFMNELRTKKVDNGFQWQKMHSYLTCQAPYI